MYLSTRKFSILITVATVALAGRSALAVRTYTTDDLFLGFHQTGNNVKDYAINLGQVAQFRDATVPFTLTIDTSAFAADMTTAFGSNWRTSGDILWGFAATTQNSPSTAPDDITRLLYVSEPVNSVPTASSSQSSPSTNVINFKNYWIGTTSDAVEGALPNSAIGNPTNSNSWAARAATGFGSNNLMPFEVPFADPIDLFRVPQTANQTLVTNEGQFTINLTNDTITFNPVPEPSALTLLGAALLGSLGFLRSRAVTIAC